MQGEGKLSSAIDAMGSVELSPLTRFFDSVANWSHRVGGALLVAATASRCLFPSEDASSGTGVLFLPLSLACGICYAVERTAGVRGPRFRWLGWAWVVLLVGWWSSMMHATYRYPAEVMLWEWIGVATVCLYARHWQATGGPKTIASLVIAIVLCQSILSVYQVGYQLPKLRQMYEQGEGNIRLAMREIGVEPGGALDRPFRDRLYSNEPFGTTGHPNTMAGLLVLGMPLALSLAWSSFGRPGIGILGTCLSLTVAMSGLAALVASKSRSAWIGFAISLFALWLLGRNGAGWWRQNLGRLIAVVVALAALVGAMAWGGLLDRLVVAESFKSLQYRWEWWQASARVIAESPIWGVGAGSFRDFYLAYKLPFSSEEIADPHNFAIELLATGGLLTLLGYLAVLGLSLRNALVSQRAIEWEEPVGLTGNGGLVVGGLVATAAFLWLNVGFRQFAFDPAAQVKAAAFVASILVVHVIGRLGVDWSERTVRNAIVAGVVGVHVHWLAAGGVGFPAPLLLTFVLLGVCSQEENDPRPVPFGSNAALTALVSVGIVVFGFAWLAPAIERDLIGEDVRTIETEIARIQETVPPSAVAPTVWLKLVPEYSRWVTGCRRMAESLPGDRGGWERLAIAETARMRLLEQLRSPEAEGAYRNGLDAWNEVLSLAPRRSESYRQLAHLHREAAASGRDAKAMPLALEAFRQSIALYPNSARHRWELGDQYSKMDRKREAAVEFREALRLDQTPHLDRKLSDGQRRIAESFLESLK